MNKIPTQEKGLRKDLDMILLKVCLAEVFSPWFSILDFRFSLISLISSVMS